jgi:hypothetical protein
MEQALTREGCAREVATQSATVRSSKERRRFVNMSRFYARRSSPESRKGNRGQASITDGDGGATRTSVGEAAVSDLY